MKCDQFVDNAVTSLQRLFISINDDDDDNGIASKQTNLFRMG